MLKRKTALIVLSIVLALAFIAASALALLFVPNGDGIIADNRVDGTANAAITPAKEFDKFVNGTAYYFTNPGVNDADTKITVNSSKSHGDQLNPFVINTKEQWALFADVISKQTSGYTGNKFYVLNADINLGGATDVKAVGHHATGFQGTLYGNKHTISNGTIAYQAWSNGNPVAALFAFINGGKVYDLTIANNIKFTMPTDVNGTKTLYIGGLAGFSYNPLVVNVHSQYSWTNVQTGATRTKAYIGGLIGQMQRGGKIYKSSYSGSLQYTIGSSSIGINGEQISMGGITGNTQAYTNTSYVIDQCYVSGLLQCKDYGAAIGGIVGAPAWYVAGQSVQITNCLLSGVSVKMLGTAGSQNVAGATYVNDIGLIMGEDYYQAKGSNADYTLDISNIYIVNSRVYRGSADTAGTISLTGWENNCATSVVNACSDNIVVQAASTEAVYPANYNNATVNRKMGSVSAVVTEANKNTSITKNFTVNSSSGGVTLSANNIGHISYVIGAGAAWSGASAAPQTYTMGTASNPTAGVSVAPTRTGYTFKGWSLVSSTSTSRTTGKISITASQRGNLIVYAVWELNAWSGTNPENVTITYGVDATLSAAKLTHPANASTGAYNVTFTYQWRSAPTGTATVGKEIDGAKSSTYKLTKPNYTTGTTYQVTVRATPNDNGATAYKEQTFNVTLKVNKQGITLPTAATGLIYNGSEQTGVSTTNTLITLSGETKATTAGKHIAYAEIGTNYCWGKDGGTDSSKQNIEWTIAKQTVANPTLTAGASLVYNGSKQYPTPSTNSNYAVKTNNGGTNVGDYTVVMKLNDTTNYKWKTAPATGESGDYTLNWKITKASITATAPSFTNSKISDGNVYVGQAYADLTIDQTTGTHVRAGSTANVPGTYIWQGDTSRKLLATTKSITAEFIPDDTTNYSGTTVAVAVSPTQLYLRVRELQVEYLDAQGNKIAHNAALSELRKINNMRRITADPVSIPVDFNATVNPTSLAGASLNGVTFNWQRPVGFNIQYYKGVDSNSNGISGYAANETITNIQADVVVYLGYVAQQVNYTLVRVMEDLTDANGVNHTPGTSDILGTAGITAGLAALKTTLDGYGPGTYDRIIKVETLTANAGSKATASNSTVDGFTRQLALEVGNNTYYTDDTNKFVLGNGETVLITYYKRNTYSITWNFTGGNYVVDPADPTNNTAYNKYTITDIQYGAAFPAVITPNYDASTGYSFDKWYLDPTFTQVANFGVYNGVMPASNLTFHAGRKTKEYTITYNYDLSNLAQEHLGLNVLPNGYVATPANASDNGPDKYNVEQLINSGNITLGKPTLTGFKFDGWYYTDETGQEKKITIISRSIIRNFELTAHWSPNSSTIVIDVNGGDRISPTSFKQVNFAVYDKRISDPANNNFVPTRAGYTFAYWAYKNNDNEFVQIDAGTSYISLSCGTRVYAIWDPKPVTISYSDDTQVDRLDVDTPIRFKSTNSELDSDTWYTLEELNDSEFVFKDDVLTIEVNPTYGYDISSIMVGGVSFSNGGRYTVRTYANDELIIDIRLMARHYNVRYEFNGGSLADGVSLPRATFVVDSDDPEHEIEVVGGDLIKKTGYEFLGWSPYSVVGVHPDAQILNDASKDIDLIDAAEEFGAGNVTLYANWTPGKVKMVYRNDYIGVNSDGSIVTQEKVFTDDTTMHTGDEITLFQPREGESDFVPQNRELIGWALQPSGDIAYNVSYKFVSNGSNSELQPQPTRYVVQPTEREPGQDYSVNTLYAVWRVTNVQYVAFEAENNDRQYSDDASYTGVTLTARPRYAYQKEPGLRLEFSWYKVDKENWSKWTVADLEGKTGDERNQLEANIGMYKIPASATPLRAPTVLNDRDGVAGAMQFDTYNFRNVNEGGLYICALKATGKYYSSVGGLKETTITMYGQYEVIINKANLPAITLTSPEAPSTYTGAAQNLLVTPSADANWPFNSATNTYTLPDGSALKVNYKYTELNTSEEYIGSVTEVGEYMVEATFEFVNDKGNYNTPNRLIAQYDIVQREIENVTYVIQSLIEGVWTNVQPDSLDGLSYLYSRNPFRVLATSTDVVASDAAITNGLSIVVRYYGNNISDPDENPENVGVYSAYSEELQGSRAANYKLSSDLSDCEFEISKNTHNVEFVFADKTETYDGTIKELSITEVIENKGTENESRHTPVRRTTGYDLVDLDDGSTLKLEYSIADTDRSYVNSAYNPKDGNARGEKHAGDFTITVSITEAGIATDIDNYEVMDDLTANLTIRQATYKGDGVNPGLSDTQLNRYVTGSDGNPTTNYNGFGENRSIQFNSQASYDPKLNLTGEFTVVYKYAGTYQDGNKFGYDVENPQLTLPTWKEDTSKTGLHDAGNYTVTAEIAYNTNNTTGLQYSNDYLVIPDQVVELKILPNEIDYIDVVYNQNNKNIYYGDTFDFYDMIGDNTGVHSVVQVYIVYKAEEGGTPDRELVSNNNVSFLNEAGEPFTAFDRASHVRTTKTIIDDTTVDADGNKTKDYYYVKASVYGRVGKMAVAVQQAVLNYSGIAFDSNDENVQLSNNSWSYGFIYDGKGHYPAVDNANGGYNFVGVNGDNLVAGSTDTSKDDIVAKYEYSTDGSTYLPLPTTGFVSATNGTTTILRVLFENKNTNYATLPSSAQLTANVTVLQKSLASSDIIWQYSSNANFTPATTKILPQNANLTYVGDTGHYVRAVFRNLEQDNTSASDYYLTVEEIQITSGEGTQPDGKKSVVNIVNADTYSIKIGKLQTGANNYALPTAGLTANIKIDPKQVDLTWTVTGGSLTYTSQDQIASGIKATYTTGTTDAADIINIAVDAEHSDYADFINAGSYTLVASLKDTNYAPKNGSFSVSIKPYAITETNTPDLHWYYVDEEGKEQSADVASVNTVYAGAPINVYVKYAVLGTDGNVEDDNTHNVADGLDANEKLPYNAGDYTLTAKSHNNYDLSAIKHKFTVKPREMTVDWKDSPNEYNYDGKPHTIQAELYGIGADSNDPIIVLSGATQRDANLSNTKYTTYAMLDDNHVGNYVLVGNDNGRVAFEWTIKQIALDITWNTDGLVYNGYDINDWSYTINNAQKDSDAEDATVDIIQLEYVITFNGQAVPAMKAAGEYLITVVGSSNNNYAIDSLTPQTVVVDKATPNITDVVYREYKDADNVTYLNNKTGLRNEKLEWNSHGVEGTLTFTDEKPDLSRLNLVYYSCTFTPVDTDNYKTVEYTDLYLTVKNDTIKDIGFNNEKLALVYAVGLRFSTYTVQAYFQYSSYYEEVIDNKIVGFGQRVLIDPVDNKIDYIINNMPIDGTYYEFTEDDVGEQIIYVHATDSTGRPRSGEIRVTVVNALPTKLTITNKEELENGDNKYYVNTTFDKSLAKFYVEYKTESSNGEIDSSMIDVQNATLPNTAGTWTITFTYFTNLPNQVSDSITIKVSPKDVIKAALESTTLRYTGETLDLNVLTEDGKDLPRGISYSISDPNGLPIHFMEEGEYSVVIKFTVDESMYEPIADITTTVHVRRIVAELNRDLVKLPVAQRTYDGNAVSREDYTLKGTISVIDNENEGNYQYKIIDTVYKVNNRVIDENTEIINAGTYKFVVILTVQQIDVNGTVTAEFPIEESYTITIDKAVNEITGFAVSNWIYTGEASGIITIDKKFGEPTYEFRDLETGNYVSSTLPTAIGKYSVTATIHGTENYDEVSSTATFTVTKPMITSIVDASTGESLKDNSGKDKVQVTAKDGIDPSYNLRVSVIKDVSNISIKKQIVMGGYNIDIVDSKNNVVTNPGTYTVRLLLTAEQLNSKNLKVYSIDEYGYQKEVSGASVENGYLVFSTNDFNGNFVISAKDVAAARRTGLMIGLCVGGVVVVAAVTALIVVVIKKKKEND